MYADVLWMPLFNGLYEQINHLGRMHVSKLPFVLSDQLDRASNAESLYDSLFTYAIHACTKCQNMFDVGALDSFHVCFVCHEVTEAVMRVPPKGAQRPLPPSSHLDVGKSIPSVLSLWV